MQNKNWFAMIAAGAMLGFGAGLSGCDVDDEGAFDETEENLNEGLEETGEGLEEATEETGEAIEEGVDETGDAMEDIGDEIDDEVDPGA